MNLRNGLNLHALGAGPQPASRVATTEAASGNLVALPPLSGDAASGAIDPSDFTTVIDNPLHPLPPGATFVFRSEDGAVLQKFEVTRETVTIDGVQCVVAHDTEFVDGKLVEDTYDYFAQNKDGSVWYFGEYASFFDAQGNVNHEGSWLSGVEGASAGIIMEAHPRVGDSYDQENAPGVAEDHAEVAGMGRNVDIPYGAFGDALKIKETTSLAPGDVAFKYYVEGVGVVLTTEKGNSPEFLTRVLIDGTTVQDTLHDTPGKDFLTGGVAGDTFVFGYLDNGLRSVDVIRDYSLQNDDRIVLEHGFDSIVDQKEVNGTWRLVLAGDRDVIKLHGVVDSDGDGNILDEIDVVSAADAFAT